MRVINVEQGTPEWHAARAGRVTASRIADLTAKGKGDKPSASRGNYAAEIVCEVLTGRKAERTFQSAGMEFGNQCEAEARSYYAFAMAEDVQTVGFVIHPANDRAGCSPDGLVGDDGLVQFKCPYTATHIETLQSEKIPGNYLKQMQWEMACTGRAWCDFVSYDVNLPGPMKAFVKRVMRDDNMIAELEREVVAFLAEVDETVAALRAKFLTEESAAA
jgi:putative phage-type endonuclease